MGWLHRRPRSPAVARAALSGPPPSTAASTYTDTFTGSTGTALTAHTPDAGGSWSVHASYSGAAQITATGRARLSTSGTEAVLYWSDTPASANYAVSALVYVASASGVSGVVARCLTAADTNVYLRFSASTGVLSLGHVVSGTDTALATSSVGWAPGDNHRIRLVVSAAQATAYVDDVAVLGPVTVTPSAAGKSGLYFFGSLFTATDSTFVHLDDFLGNDPLPLDAGPAPSWRSYAELPSLWRPSGYELQEPPPSGGYSDDTARKVHLLLLTELGATELEDPPPAPWRSYPEEPSYWRPSGYELQEPPPPTTNLPQPLRQPRRESAYLTTRYAALDAYPEEPAPSWRSYPEEPSYWRPSGYELQEPPPPSTGYGPEIARKVFLLLLSETGAGEVEPPIATAWAQPGAPARRTAAYLPAGGFTLDSPAAPDALPPFSRVEDLAAHARHTRRYDVQGVDHAPDPVEVLPPFNLESSSVAVATFHRRRSPAHYDPSFAVVPEPGSIGTGWNIYRDTGSATPIDYTSPVDTVEVLTWTSPTLSYPGVLSFGVRAFNPAGEERNLDAAVTVELDAAGADISRIPVAPYSLRATPLAGGVVRLEWHVVTTNRNRRPTSFNVYHGTSGVDYGTVQASVAFTGQAVYRADLSGLADGVLYSFGVRAVNATGEEQNTLSIDATADATGPTAVEGFTLTAVSLEET